MSYLFPLSNYALSSIIEPFCTSYNTCRTNVSNEILATVYRKKKNENTKSFGVKVQNKNSDIVK